MKNDEYREINRLLGARIKELRERHGLTQEQVAHSAGIDVSTLSRVERGALSIAINKLPALCRAMGIEAGEIFEPAED